MTLNKWLYYVVLAGLFILPITPLLISSSLLFLITGKAFFFRLVVSVIFAAWLLLALREPQYRPKLTPSLIMPLALWFGCNFSHHL